MTLLFDPEYILCSLYQFFCCTVFVCVGRSTLLQIRCVSTCDRQDGYGFLGSRIESVCHTTFFGCFLRCLSYFLHLYFSFFFIFHFSFFSSYFCS